MKQIDFDEAREQVIAAQGVVAEATRWRKGNRRKLKKDHPRRVAAIESLLEKIDKAMKPLRSHIGRLPWIDYPEDIEWSLGEVSDELQAERRQLKKMLP